MAKYRLNQAGVEKVSQQVTEAVTYIYSELKALLDQPEYSKLADFINLDSMELILADGMVAAYINNIKRDAFNELEIRHNSVAVDTVRPLIYITFKQNEGKDVWDIIEDSSCHWDDVVAMDCGLALKTRENYPENQYPAVKVRFTVGNYSNLQANILVIIHVTCEVEDSEEEEYL